ncbi:MAG: GNAT family N-acetyltransferase [Gammaproteobacteria bacterium]|jgi:predicted GNAT family N-acyltransferase
MRTGEWSHTDMAPGDVCAVDASLPVIGRDPQINLRTAEFCRDRAAIRSVRFAVFVDEQAVPAELEMDERDPECFHVVATTSDGTAVGTGRIDIAAGGRIGRMAVLRSFRGLGVGTMILEALHEYALERGCQSCWCHAQVAARSFYERSGYVAEGEVFEEAGIDHITMRCRLGPP